MDTTTKAELAFFVSTCSVVTAGPSAAQNYPTKPIRMIVPAAAGGAPDIQARFIANELSRQMGQQVAVENRPGASSIIGFEAIAKAAPDGYTVGMVPTSFILNTVIFAKLPYDAA